MSQSNTRAVAPLIASFVAGTAITSAVSCYLMSRKFNINDQREDRTRNRCSSGDGGATVKKALPEELREEQLSRCSLYFGEEGMKKLSGSKVVVVGLGGVGSHAAHMLARAGVSYLRLIDFDQVTLSSLNRHACATLKDVGTPKAVCLKEYLEQICPDPRFLQMDVRVQMYTSETQDMLDGGVDMVLDCIDDIPTKAALLAHCVQKNIRVISCMGAGGKSDVTRLHISDLRSASRDPLASKLRQTLKKLVPATNSDGRTSLSFLENMDQVAVVYSSEKTVVKLADFTEEQKEEGVHHFGAVDGMRIRVLPVLGTMPAIMGQSLAAMAICELGDKPFSPVAGERVGKNVRHKLFQHLKRREAKIRAELEATATSTREGEEQPRETFKLIDGKWVGPVQIDVDDVEYLLAEVWRNRCAVTGDRLGAVLELTRWDLSKPALCNNLVLMGARALERFDAEGKASVPKEIQKNIEARLASCREDVNA